MAEKNYSGKFVVRVHPNIHKRLVLEARKQGTSLNGVVKALLMAGLKKDKEKFGSVVS